MSEEKLKKNESQKEKERVINMSRRMSFNPM